MLKLPDTIKWIITDFDGIVTDNFVYIDNNGAMSRRINFQDVVGFYKLHKNGYEIAIISGEQNAAINILAKKFNLKEVHTGISDKIKVLKSIISKYNLSQEEYIYLGDDINDTECLKYAKYPITVPHSVNSIKEINGIQVTEKVSGFGAFREVADCLTD